MKKRTKFVIAVLVLVVATTATAARITPGKGPAGPKYELTIVSPVETDTYPAGINDSGVIAAECYDAQWRMHGYTFGRSQTRDLGPGTSASGINNSGAVCGWKGWDACWWPKNQDLQSVAPGGDDSFAYGINSRNEIVGKIVIYDPLWYWYWVEYPYVFDGAVTMLSTDIGCAIAINNQGLIGGYVCVGDDPSVPCLWQKGKGGYNRIDLPMFEGDWGGAVDALDDAGNAAGATVDSSGIVSPILWRRVGSRYIAEHLPRFPDDCWVHGMNNRGQVVGETDWGIWAACMWDGGRIYDLNDLVADNKGCTLLVAVGINNSGLIACQARYSPTGKNVSVLLTPTQAK